MAHDNLALLTSSHSAIAAKKRAKHAQIKEIVFDDEARRYVAPRFHRARDQLLQILFDRVPQTQGRTTRARKEKGTAQREAGTTRDAARGAIPCFTPSLISLPHSIVARSRNGPHGMPPKSRGRTGLLQVRERGFPSCRPDPCTTDSDVGEWGGVSSEPEGVEEEYEGEEQLATVTVVQDFDLSTLLHGPPRAPGPTRAPVEEEVKRTRRTKPAKVKYETKAARRAERRKQRARRTEKAERAR